MTFQAMGASALAYRVNPYLGIGAAVLLGVALKKCLAEEHGGVVENALPVAFLLNLGVTFRAPAICIWSLFRSLPSSGQIATVMFAMSGLAKLHDRQHGR